MLAYLIKLSNKIKIKNIKNKKKISKIYIIIDKY